MTLDPLRSLGMSVLAIAALAIATPQLRAQNQLVLGDSAETFSLQPSSTTTLQLQFSTCGADACTLSGSAYGAGVFASSDGHYALSSSAANPIVLTATSDDSGSSFGVTSSQPLAFTYAAPEGTLNGELSLTSLVQGNGSSTGTLSGELVIEGGSLAPQLAAQQGEVSLLVPLGAPLASLLAQGGSATGQIGYPSTVTLAPASGEACPACRDFVTGGGWIQAPDGAKANFGVHGGLRQGAFWGHLEYNDHGTAPPMMVKSASITNYVVLSDGTREVDGTAAVNGHAGYTFRVVVSDRDSGGGEGPGPNHADTFTLTLSNGYSASGQLGGGDIEIHRGDCTPKLEQQGSVEKNERGGSEREER